MRNTVPLQYHFIGEETAVKKGHTDTVALLLDHGANIHADDAALRGAVSILMSAASLGGMTASHSSG